MKVSAKYLLYKFKYSARGKGAHLHERDEVGRKYDIRKVRVFHKIKLLGSQ